VELLRGGVVRVDRRSLLDRDRRLVNGVSLFVGRGAVVVVVVERERMK
jgi:hypothetical protein